MMTNDPEWDAERASWPAPGPEPECSECGQVIEDDDFFEIDGFLYCEDCANKMFRITYGEWKAREEGMA